jgi:hypothetical protein
LYGKANTTTPASVLRKSYKFDYALEKKLKKSFYLKFVFLMSCILSSIPALAIDQTTLKWDLSYESAIKQYALADNEFMYRWPKSLAVRPIHEKLSQYQGEEIIASVLIEKPDGHAGDPSAIWFIQTKFDAKFCFFYKKQMNEACNAIDVERFQVFVREVLAFPRLKPINNQLIDQNTQLNYFGFISIYENGRSTQRPIFIQELSQFSEAYYSPDFGRLERVMIKATQSEKDLLAYDAEMRSQNQNLLLRKAIKAGDITSIKKQFADNPILQIKLKKDASFLEDAVKSRQKNSIEILLQRGADIDANESAGLKAAIQNNDDNMMTFLIENGAKIDPPISSLNSYKKVFTSPLSVAISQRRFDMAKTLINMGANVNLPQSRPIIVTAVQTLDRDLIDYLLKKGIDPNQISENEQRSALMFLISIGSKGGMNGGMDENKKSILENIVRRLVLAGANINYINRGCSSAYTTALDEHNEFLQKLLIDLGADIGLQDRCRNIARQANTISAEFEMRNALSKRYSQLLFNKDYRSLETDYQNLIKKNERTPSGIWKQAIFYNELNNFLADTTDSTYWVERESRAKGWSKQFPKSIPAQLFLANLYIQRAMAVRGIKQGKDLRVEDINEFRMWGEKAYSVLVLKKTQLSKDPQWYKLMLQLIPYSYRTTDDAKNYLADGMKRYPNYHEMVFMAAFYLQEKWYGAPDDIEKLAQKMKVVVGNKELSSAYARLYWYLDQNIYRGTLFEQTQIKWDEMRHSLDDLIKLYPDSWNRNAYAYFACKAQDYTTMEKQIKLLGEQIMADAWGGTRVYQDCAMPLASPQERAKRADMTDTQRAQKEQDKIYQDTIRHSINLNKTWQYKQSFDYLKIAKIIDQNLGRVKIQTQYNLGVALLNLGRYQEALMAFDLGLTVEKQFVGIYLKKGMCLELLGRKEDALANFEKVNQLWNALVKANKVVVKDDEKEEVKAMYQKLSDYGLTALPYELEKQ